MAFILKSTARPLVANVVNNNAVLLSSARGIIWFGKKDIRMPKDFDHATGEERLVNVAKTQGIPDPFDMAEQVRGPGTKGNKVDHENCLIILFPSRQPQHYSKLRRITIDWLQM